MRALILTALVLSSLTSARAQQEPDRSVDVGVDRPAFARDAGPAVVIDGGHYNFHTVDGRFAPFADLLRNDGFRVAGSTEIFSADSLKTTQILVISNALNVVNSTAWKVPTPSAFTAAEIEAVRTWVNGGGSLLLIADHFPMAGAAADLAAAFGFKMQNGYVRRLPPAGPDMFTVEDGSLRDDPVLKGRDSRETVRKVVTFTGSAFEAPAGARPILVLPKGFDVWFTTVAGEFTQATPRRDGAGLLQGAVMNVGKGRVALFGEAAMFSAQRIAGPKPFLMGFNAPHASENKQFILNLLRWLAGL